MSILVLSLFLLGIGTKMVDAQNGTGTTPTTPSTARTPAPPTTMFVGQFNIGGTVQNSSSLSQQVSLNSNGVLSVTVGPFSAAGNMTTGRTTTTTTTTASSTATTDGSSAGLFYAALPPVNLACIGLQLYVCLFGRRMRMHGLRWFTLYYNLWNIYQVVVVSDTSEASPWKGWLADVRFVQNRAALELLTMSVFPIGVVFLVPLLLLSHFCFCCALRWLPWLPLFFLLLTIGPLFIYNGAVSFTMLPVVKGNATVTVGNGTSADLLEAYAFMSMSLAWSTTVYLVPMALVALLFFLCYRLLNRYNPASNHPMRASRMVDLFLLVPFLFLVLAFHLPCFMANLSTFFVVNLWPVVSAQLLPLLAGSGGGGGGNGTTTPNPLKGGGGAGNMAKMMELLNYYNQIVAYKEDTLMMLPLVEFLASFLFIRMFREQYLALVSCYACYKGDKDGACGVCCGGGGSGKAGRRWGGGVRVKHPRGGKIGASGGMVGAVPGPTTVAVPAGAMMVVPADPRMWAQPVMRPRN